MTAMTVIYLKFKNFTVYIELGRQTAIANDSTVRDMPLKTG